MKIFTLTVLLAAGLLAFGVARARPESQATPTASAPRTAAYTAPKTLASVALETGLVKWGRDLDAALAQSEATGKPVLVLFQEVPGCSGCQDFGRTVLSDPLLVEAIETEFLPVVVYNNRSSGSDPQLMKRFNEPAWNYQVIRFLNAQGKDILPRQDRVWTLGPVADRMAQALKKAQRPVPRYLESISLDNNETQHKTAAFAMYCYWTGEYRLGGLEGVASTEAGWFDGHEVTRVRYDPKLLSLDTLAQTARAADCGDKLYTPEGTQVQAMPSGTLGAGYRLAKASDQKKQLARWPEIHKVPGLNATQLTKINALAPGSRDAARSWLSPRQNAFLDRSAAR